jgi:hypothetical protein
MHESREGDGQARAKRRGNIHATPSRGDRCIALLMKEGCRGYGSRRKG